MGMAAVFKSLTYLLIQFFIDDVLIQGRFGTPLLLVAGGFIGLAGLEGVCTFISRRSASQTAEGVALRLRNYMYDHIQRQPFTYHDGSQTGELIQRSTSDIDAIRRFFADQAIMAGRIILLFVVNFGAIAYLNLRLALYSIVVIPLVLLFSYFFFKRVSTAYEDFQEQEAKLSTTLQENLSGIRVVKAFARQQYEDEKFEKENWIQFLKGRRLLLMHSAYWPVSDILSGFQMLAGFTIGALMAINGTITVGTYLAYAGLVIWLIWPMRNLGRIIVEMSMGLVSLERVLTVLRSEREPLLEGSHHPAGDLRGEITFKDLNFAYDENHPVLQDINLHVQPGQVVALMGSTGSGKTSLVNLLARFYDYTSGSITLDGVELTAYTRAYLRRQIGFVEQEPFLFSRTIRENIAFGVDRAVSDEEIEAAARASAIHEVILGFPEGYNTLVGERGVTLSGGQKQRTVLARTLLKNPRILVLDDATSSVDTETEGDIRDALNSLMKDRTTFIIAHRVQSVMNADQIAVFDKGRIVQLGNHADLLAQPGIYQRIYDVQARVEEELERELAAV
jgi:ATP-binding cassette subfamily B protein